MQNNKVYLERMIEKSVGEVGTYVNWIAGSILHIIIEIGRLVYHMYSFHPRLKVRSRVMSGPI